MVDTGILTRTGWSRAQTMTRYSPLDRASWAKMAPCPSALLPTVRTTISVTADMSAPSHPCNLALSTDKTPPMWRSGKLGAFVISPSTTVISRLQYETVAGLPLLGMTPPTVLTIYGGNSKVMIIIMV